MAQPLHLLAAPAANNPEGAGQKAVETADAVEKWWQDPATREWLIEHPIRIAIILLIAIIAHAILRRVISRVAQHSIDNKPSSNPVLSFGKGRRAAEAAKRATALESSKESRRVSRIRTLANVSRSAAAIFVWVTAIIAILSEVGVNVAPLIASAGVIGVALGFGAQSLVKDFLSGIFMLIEDQYGIGDCIDLGDGTFGDVESITLRITTVRDIDGALWYVRNGEILKVANHSDSFSIARLQIPVGLTNDTQAARDIIEQAARRAVQDATVAGKVIDEPVLNGVTEFNPDYLSYRLSIKTLPGAQWDVQRAVYAEVLNAMNAHGISTPYPHGVGSPRAIAGQQVGPTSEEESK